MQKEKNYDFLKRMQEFHIPGRRTVFSTGSDMVEVTSEWCIRVPAAPTAAEVRAAEDFRDYLRVSMGVTVAVVKSDAVAEAEIFFTDLGTNTKRGAYEIEVAPGRIAVRGDDFRGVLRGNVALEDIPQLPSTS